MTPHQRDHLVLLIANDFAVLLAQEQTEQFDALLQLVIEIECASMRWVSAWAKGAQA